jgi:2-polyprenyl-3-methyl-5-hydroxy-6-metoxy-1,4-benzoquinol methylase
MKPLLLWRSHELESIACDFCNSSASRKLIVRPDGMQVVECASCELAYLNPRPKPELLPRFYERDYFVNKEGNSSFGYVDYLSSKSRRARVSDSESKLRLLEEFWKPQGSHCLEVGCATGEYCYILSRHGAQPVGLDLSEFAILEARKTYPQLDFRTGGIESISNPSAFDAVFAFELIEHVTSPSRFFQCVRSILKPNGIFVLTTPNLACGKHVGLSRWIGFNTSFEHLYFFSRKTLAQLGTQQGFEVVQWFTGCGPGVDPEFRELSAKDRIRSTLRSVGLLGAAQKVKEILLQKKAPPTYSQGGTEHNLLMVLRKCIRS